MESRAYYASFLLMLPAALLLGATTPPVVEYIKSIEAEIILSPFLLIPIYVFLSLFILQKVYFISHYTDEYLPIKLGVFALALSVLGMFTLTRLIILGTGGLILSTYWTRNNVWAYYRKFRY